MTDCAGFDMTIQLLFDGELVGNELDQAREHLQTCSDCKQRFEEEERLSQIVRQARSPLVAPASLRDRVLQITTEASFPKPQIADRHRPSTALMPDHRRASSTVWAREHLSLIAAMLLITLAAILFPHQRNRVNANKFIDTAILADHSLSNHMMPLDVQSNSPKEITAWFSDKVPFQFRLPNAGIAGDDTAKYKLVGGRLVSFRGEHAALIAFRMSDEHISLLIASDRLAKAVGGTVSESNGLVFHSKQMKNHNVVTWDNRGLTYALIFSAAPSGRRACSACHQGVTANDKPLADSAHLLRPY
jgi:anti-sigma factor RsiW